MRTPLAALSVVFCAAVARPASAQIDAPKQAVMILADGKAAFGEVGTLSKSGVSFKPDGWKTGTTQPWPLVKRIHTQAADYTPEPAKVRFQRADADRKSLRHVGAKPGGVVLGDGTSIQGRVLVLTPAGVAVQKTDAPIGQWYDARAVARVEVDGEKYECGAFGALEKAKPPPPVVPPPAAAPPKSEPPPPAKEVEEEVILPRTKDVPKVAPKPEPPKAAPPPPQAKTEAAPPAKAADDDVAKWLWRLIPTGTIFAVVCFVLKWSLRLLVSVVVGAVMFGVVGAIIGGLAGGVQGASIGWSAGSVLGMIGGVAATWEQLKEELAAGNGPAQHSGPDLPYLGED
jgi:hypothetical protein